MCFPTNSGNENKRIKRKENEIQFKAILFFFNLEINIFFLFARAVQMYFVFALGTFGVFPFQLLTCDLLVDIKIFFLFILFFFSCY